MILAQAIQERKTSKTWLTGVANMLAVFILLAVCGFIEHPNVNGPPKVSELLNIVQTIDGEGDAQALLRRQHAFKIVPACLLAGGTSDVAIGLSGGLPDGGFFLHFGSLWLWLALNHGFYG